MKKDITRAIIDATLDRGLREIYEDPRRSIRKLADLGRRFQKGRFTQDVYALFQDMLRNDDSPYYTAIEHLLQFTDRKKLKDYGINLGYNSFTKGSKEIRKQAEKGLRLPWNVIIRMDPGIKNGISPHDLISVIAQGRKMGIYSYVIRLESSIMYLEDLIKVFITYDDCAFILFLPDEEIPLSAASYIAECSNVIYFLPIFDDSCGSNVTFLKRYKAWYGLYTEYDEETGLELIDHDSAWDYLIHDSAFLLTVAKDGTSREFIDKTEESVKKLRLEPVVPLVVFDLYGDSMAIQKLILGESYFFEILSDGSFFTGKGLFNAKEGLPDLEKAFREYL